MGIERLCYGERNGTLVFGASAQSVAAHPAFGREIDLQSVYDYLFFHMIPVPRHDLPGCRKLLPGECLIFENGTTRRSFYWQADYTPEPGKDSLLPHRVSRPPGQSVGAPPIAARTPRHFFPAGPTVPPSSAA